MHKTKFPSEPTVKRSNQSIPSADEAAEQRREGMKYLEAIKLQLTQMETRLRHNTHQQLMAIGSDPQD